MQQQTCWRRAGGAGPGGGSTLGEAAQESACSGVLPSIRLLLHVWRWPSSWQVSPTERLNLNLLRGSSRGGLWVLCARARESSASEGGPLRKGWHSARRSIGHQAAPKGQQLRDTPH
eukprot:14880341-Alexandrium_andersonii.AAC.1